jgi:hypothetical protein
MSLRVANLVTAACVLALAAYLFLESRTFGERSALLPTILAVVLGLLAAVLFASNLRRDAVVEGAAPFSDVPWVLWTFSVVLLFAFGVGTMFIGFYESAFVFIALVTFAMSSEQGWSPRTAVVSVAYSVAFTALLFIAFKVILRIATPPGILIG